MHVPKLLSERSTIKILNCTVYVFGLAVFFERLVSIVKILVLLWPMPS